MAFTAGQLPPKESIREIRINQNPFSAEFDKLGYGRIEVFTKPGTDKFHGQFFDRMETTPPSTRQIRSAAQPAGLRFHAVQRQHQRTDQLRKASFFVDAQRRNINDLSAPSMLSLSIPHAR
jgi:hypothetical protein